MKEITTTINTGGELWKNVIVTVDNHEDFEEAGNDPDSWTNSAEDLLISAKTLFKKHKEAHQLIRKGGKKVIPEFYCLSVAIMLTGMAIENLLKAVYAKKSKIITNGKFSPPKEFRNHNLVSMANHVNIHLADDETKILNKISTAITFYGRYPIPVSEDKWRPRLKGCDGRQPKFSWSENSRIKVNKILKKIGIALDS